MLKEIDKKWLMSFELCGKIVMIETDIGGIKERFYGAINKQRFAGLAQEIILSIPAGLFTIGIDSVKKAYLSVSDELFICPDCKKVYIFNQWVNISVPEFSLLNKHCPDCEVKNETAKKGRETEAPETDCQAK